MFSRLIPLVLAGLALAACGGDDSSSASDVPTANSATTSQSSSSVSRAAEPEGHCALISPAEIEALIPIELNLGEPKVVGKPENPFHACEVQLGIGEVGQLTFGTTTEAVYNEYAKYLDRSSASARRIEGLGEEAFLLNEAQLLVRRGDGQYLNVALMLITMTELPLTQEQLSEAVIEIGTRMAERL